MTTITHEPGTTVAVPNARGPFHVSIGANGFDAANVEHIIAANNYDALVADALRTLEPGTAAAIAHGSHVVLVTRVNGPCATIAHRFRATPEIN
jgi:hypothetical protein